MEGDFSLSAFICKTEAVILGAIILLIENHFKFRCVF
jgi:hypothetical protein